MAGVKISNLPAVPTAPLVGDLVPIVQPASAGTTYKATLAQVITLAGQTVVTPADGGIVYTDANSLEVLAPTATANKVLMSGANTAPHWSTPTYPTASGTAGQILRSDGTNNVYTTATYPTTTTINQLLYSSSANTIAGLATANSAMLATTSAGVPVWSASATNGQLLIGSTGATPALGTITAGAGISITNAAGSITIGATGGGLTINNVTGASSTMAVNSLNIANNAGLVTLTLPATAAVGDVVEIRGSGAGGWIIAQNAGDIIHVGSVASTAGVGGSVASTNRYDCINLTCVVANDEWSASGVQGILTVV